MPLLSLPHAEFFDSVEPLEAVLGEAPAIFPPAPALSVSLPHFLMWRDAFAYGLARKQGVAFLVALYGRNVYLPIPPSPFSAETLTLAFAYMKEVNGPGPGISRVEGMTEERKEAAEGWGFKARPTLLEYLYEREALAGLHGDVYRAKRAEINHLLKDHSVLLRPFRSSDLGACGELYEAWKAQRLPSYKDGIGEKMLLASQKAHARALKEGEDWGLDAWVAWVDGRLAAYTAGAALGGGTYGIHLEVADLTVKGLSAYIFANVARQLTPFRTINAGDAEGLPGLAEAKEHWQPSHRLQLYALDPRS